MNPAHSMTSPRPLVEPSYRERTSARLRSVLTSFALHGMLTLASCVALYPILWVLSLAFSKATPVEPKIWPIPTELSLLHFETVLGHQDASGRWLFFHQALSSIVVSLATALVALAIATPAAFALSRFTFVGKDAGTRALLATQMFPGVAAAIPLYFILDTIGLMDSHMGLVLVYATTAVPFAIFQLRSAFDAIPRDLEEAAMVDGAGRFTAFLLVVLPAARPALAVTGLFAFMAAWNEFVLAATFMSREEAFTLPVALSRYVGEHDTQWGAFAAGAVLVSTPVMALFFWLQRHIVSGLTEGSVKG